jgi:hypothetical protein
MGAAHPWVKYLCRISFKVVDGSSTVPSSMARMALWITYSCPILMNPDRIGAYTGISKDFLPFIDP